MTACIVDDFSDVGPLGSADTGEPWATTVPFAVDAVGAYQVSAGANGNAWIENYLADVIVAGTWRLSTGYAEVDVRARVASPAGTGLVAALDRDNLGNDRVTLAVGASTVAVKTGAGLVRGGDHSVAMWARGRSVVVALDAVAVIAHTLTDAQIATLGGATGVGFSHHRSTAYSESDAGGSRLLDFSACPVGGWKVGAL